MNRCWLAKHLLRLFDGSLEYIDVRQQMLTGSTRQFRRRKLVSGGIQCSATEYEERKNDISAYSYYLH